jgi:RNA polymerase sigma-70 factor (ECF subfamily)
MNRKDALKLLETEYMPKILGFCYAKLNERSAAEDLAQDIAEQVLRAIHSEREIINFNALVWSISNHTFFNRLRREKYGQTAYLSELFPSEEDIESEFILKEQLALLRGEIAFLSKNYRDTVVLHYFNGKTCEEIARELGRSAGTVKWWLHGARQYIREGMKNMREYGERSYNPGRLAMSCQGSPGANYEPMSCAKNLMAQNILLAAYNKPHSIEELCAELGVAAPYIEDEVSYLTANQLLAEVSGRYQTDFMITKSTRSPAWVDKVYEKCFPAYYNALKQLLETHKTLLTSAAMNTAGFTWERLQWVYIHMITDMCLNIFKREVCKIVTGDKIPDRPNGGKWIALGYEQAQRTDSCVEDKPYRFYDGPVHNGSEGAQGFFHYWSGDDCSVFFGLPSGVFTLCGEVIRGNISPDKFSDEQKFLFSAALEAGLFVNENGVYRQNYWFAGIDDYRKIADTARGFYAAAKPYFRAAFDIALAEYGGVIPERVRPQSGNLMSNTLNYFTPFSLYTAVLNGDIAEVENETWLSLFVVG